MSKLLYPFAWIYELVMWIRNWCYDQRIFRVEKVSVPVISVGNLTTGGTGKTPMVEYLVRHFLSKGKNIAVLSRGYRRQSTGTIHIGRGDQARGNAELLGDELFQLSRKFPAISVIAETQRRKSAHLAIDKYAANVIILDDGFQHRSLARDLDILMVGMSHDLYNEPMLPAGMRREPLNAIQRANVIAQVDFKTSDERQLDSNKFNAGEGVGITTARVGSKSKIEDSRINVDSQLSINVATIPVDLKQIFGEATLPLGSVYNKSCVAFSGIANPLRFKKTLERLGVNVKKFIQYPDHHNYSDADFRDIRDAIEQNKPDYVLTTEKDAVRMLSLPESGTILGSELYYLSVEMRITNHESDFHYILSSMI